MDDVSLVKYQQRLEELLCNVTNLVDRKSPLFLYVFGESWPVDEFHDEVLELSDLAQIEDADQIPVVDVARQGGLATKAPERGATGVPDALKLERDFTCENSVVGSEYHAMPATPELFPKLVSSRNDVTGPRDADKICWKPGGQLLRPGGTQGTLRHSGPQEPGPLFLMA